MLFNPIPCALKPIPLPPVLDEPPGEAASETYWLASQAPISLVSAVQLMQHGAILTDPCLRPIEGSYPDDPLLISIPSDMQLALAVGTDEIKAVLYRRSQAATRVERAHERALKKWAQDAAEWAVQHARLVKQAEQWRAKEREAQVAQQEADQLAQAAFRAVDRATRRLRKDRLDQQRTRQEYYTKIVHTFSAHPPPTGEYDAQIVFAEVSEHSVYSGALRAVLVVQLGCKYITAIRMTPQSLAADLPDVYGALKSANWWEGVRFECSGPCGTALWNRESMDLSIDFDTYKTTALK